MRDRFIGIAGWQKNTFIDYPGMVSTILFYSGCNLRCPYCHNSDLVFKRNALPCDPECIWEFLVKCRSQIDGVVLSGGEPTLHQAMPRLVADIRTLGYSVKLDTNGLRPDDIERAAPDYLALDIKTRPDLYPSLLHARETDVARKLKKAVDIVRVMGNRAEIRITIAPELVDEAVVEEIGCLIEGVYQVYLQKMSTRVPLLDPRFNTLPAVPAEKMAAYQAVLKRFVKRCAVR